MTCTPSGLLAFSNAEVVPHGYIWPTAFREVLISTLSDIELNNPAPGVKYSPVVGNDELLLETTRQLPSRGIRIESVFRKLMRSTAESLGNLSGGNLAFGTPGGAALVQSIVTTTFLGGATAGWTDFTLHLLDAETKLDMAFTIPTDPDDLALFKSQGILTMTNFPMAIYAITKEPLSTPGDEVDEENLGKLKLARTGIKGAVLDDGSMNYALSDTVLGSNLANSLTDPNSIFIEIVQDERKIRYRADNEDATSRLDTPFTSNTKNDVTSKQIRIDPTGLNSGDTIYITGNFASKRRVRHALRHRGAVGQQSTRTSVAGAESFAFSFTVDAWNFKIAKWKVPTQGSLTFTGPESACSVVGDDGKVNDIPFRFVSVLEDASVSADSKAHLQTEELEGWRISENISTNTQFLWAADPRGIHLYQVAPNKNRTLIVPANSINDQKWFNQFLTDNNLIGVNIEPDDFVDLDKTGCLYDISEPNNSMLFDREKIPYHRPLALALRSVSKYASNSTGVGFPMLDLYNNNVSITQASSVLGGDCSKIGLQEIIAIQESAGSLSSATLLDSVLRSFDLSFVKFEETPMSSVFPTAYNGFTCGGIVESELIGDGAYLNPRDPANRFAVFIPRPRGELESDWLLATPTFFGGFTRKSRIFVEYFNAEIIDALTLVYSVIYADTIPAPDSSIGAEIDLFRDKAYVAFRESQVNNALSYYRFEESVLGNYLNRVEVDINGVHERGEFDANTFRFVGYNRIFADLPSYSNGRLVTSETASICSGDLEASAFYKTIELISGLSTTSLPHSIDIDANIAIRNINIKVEYDSKKVKDLRDEDFLVAFEFEGSGTTIDSVPLPIKLSNIAVDGIYTANLDLDARFYQGGPLLLHGSIWEKVHILSMTAEVVDLTDISPFTVDAEQTAVAFDSKNRIVVFYTEEESENISAVVSSNAGKAWFRFKDIIRLTSNDTASLPYALSNRYTSVVRLFYVLNNNFLMYRDVDIDQFICDDTFVDYVPPDVFDASSDDNLGLDGFSDSGKRLRQQESYFVWGDANDTFMIDEHEISRQRNEDKKSFRFKIDTKEFDEYGVAQLSLSEFDDPFEESRYAVYEDAKGVIRVLAVRDGLLSIKASHNFKSWTYHIRDIIFHRDFEGRDEEITNIQVLYDGGRGDGDIYSDDLYVVYFHNEMMFVRRLRSSLLELDDKDNDAAKALEELGKYLDINQDSQNKPIFLVGSLSSEIVQAIQSNNTNLLVQFKYPACFIEKFSEDALSVDVAAQPSGYFTKKNLARLYYQSGISGSSIIFGLTMNLDIEHPNDGCTRPVADQRATNNSINPKLDVHIKPKEVAT